MIGKNDLFYSRPLNQRINLKETISVQSLSSALDESFDNCRICSISFHEEGIYRNQQKNILMRLLFNKPIRNLPEFVEINIMHKTGKHEENIICWLPYQWNNRLLGTGGGGTSCGGRQYITAYDNYERGMTVVKAITNHFATATTDQGTTKNEWALDENSHLDRELIENWENRSTHFMTLLLKELCHQIYGSYPNYSYFHGGSGGGRQAMVEAQKYPEDYDGIWASCPAINWNHFLPLGVWPTAVCNGMHHTINRKKMEYFLKQARQTVGDDNAYYHNFKKFEFDPFSCLNHKVGNETINEKDCLLYQKIYQGPLDAQGNPVFMFHRSGNRIFNHIVPVGAFYYPLFSDKMKPFFLSVYYMRWITQNKKDSFSNITIDEFNRLYHKSLVDFDYVRAYNEDLSEFAKSGHKLIIDHGIDDPLIPVDNTIQYVQNVAKKLGAKQTDCFLKLYICPGDGHGNCKWHGPSLPESEGMKALMDWVENHKEPKTLNTVLVNKKAEIIEEGAIKPYESIY